MTRKRKKVELPPKFELAQLIALQLGVGFVALRYILKTDETTEIFKTIPNVLVIIKIISSLCAFCCIVLSGGKLITFYKELRSFIDAKNKEENE